MLNLTNDELLELQVNQVIDTMSRYDVKDITEVNHAIVMQRLLAWMVNPDKGGLTVDTDKLLELMYHEFGEEKIVDVGVVNGNRTYKLNLSNITFYIIILHDSYYITLSQPKKSIVYHSCKPPEEIIGCLRNFNERVPKIKEYIERNIANKIQEKMIHDITETTGRNIIKKLTEEGLDIPNITKVRATDNGRVVVYFADTSQKINSSLDNLRARFLNRFSKSTTK